MKTMIIENTVYENSIVHTNEKIYPDLETALTEFDRQGKIYIRAATFPNPMIDGQTIIINSLI